MLLLVKDTKFESKSQPCAIPRCNARNCFYWSKIQNLKANHNNLAANCWMLKIAFTGQRYKIWKQITTRFNSRRWLRRLLLLVKDTKFESKSQLKTITDLILRHCFYWSKIHNLKENHNGKTRQAINHLIAFTGQRYKIWKQITTFWR